MTIYKHQSTGALAELLEDKGVTVRLKVAESGEVKEVGAATFKRWWKPFEDEATAEETETPEPEAAPGEPTADQNEPEDVTPDETEAPENEEPEAQDDEGEEPVAEDTTDDDTDPDAKPLSMSEITAKLENLFDILNGLYFEGALPRPVITVQSTPKAYGRCSNKKIWSSGVEGEGDSYYEINLGAEYLNRPSEQTAATMLHEMVHLHCRENGIKETCQGVRYHTKVFKNEAEARDLEIGYDRSIGYSITMPTPELIEKLRETGFELSVPFARHTLGNGKAPQRNKSHKYECPDCGQSFRSTAELNINCGICETKMERALGSALRR